MAKIYKCVDTSQGLTLVNARIVETSVQEGVILVKRKYNFEADDDGKFDQEIRGDIKR